ncbi:MAG: hypothetical protein EBS06_03675 [Proteobacteria bacterium]|nr:hypothetical protein [Pseudomonadota bacterium]
MSEQVQKLLSQLLKTQLEKKSSKKTGDQTSPENHVLNEVEIKQQEEKARLIEAKKESVAKMAEAEKWGMYRQLIIENLARFLMIFLYCVVAIIASFKFGVMILTFIKIFLHGIFVATPPIPSK